MITKWACMHRIAIATHQLEGIIPVGVPVLTHEADDST